MNRICSDVEAQYQELDDLVSGLNDKKWFLETPFYHWTIFDEVAHVAFFDHEALLAIEDRDRFRERTGDVMEIIRTSDHWPARINPLLGPDDPGELMSLWRETRTRLLQRLREMDARDRLPWYGPDMSARSFASARLMETWAHAQDVFDTLGIKRRNGAGLRHVAHIGVTTFKWSFIVRGLESPDITPRVELIGPDGDRWEWGEPDAPEWVRGSAEAFCLIVTQRRNVADTEMQWHGKTVGKWLSIAQAFAGVAQVPPAPGVRS
ncbi:TIGR03084 family metal-binding protein [Desulfobacterales bacterium HSG2]|nr:TIGR03084 family metal-binding protein [Desulfobacterales bacterium HSG2]